MPAPDLVIYLQTPTEVLRAGCASRARRCRSSRSLGDEYVRELNEAYNHFFFHYTATPLLVVETVAVRSLVGRGSAGGPDPADPEHGQGHALLRAADLTAPPPGVEPCCSLVAQPLDSTGALVYAPVMAWFKKSRKPIEPPPDKSRVPEGPLGQVPRLRQASSTTRTSPPTCSVCPKCGHHFRLERGRTAADAVRR